MLRRAVLRRAIRRLFPLTPPPPALRYYSDGADDDLFRKITNKMIANCRNYVMEGADRSAALWEQPMMGVVARLQACLALNEGYQEQYFMTRDKLLTQPKGKQFDFNESAIFGKFDLFVRRVEKLIEMFSTVEQFSVLATHNVEGMEGLMNSLIRSSAVQRAVRAARLPKRAGNTAAAALGGTPHAPPPTAPPCLSRSTATTSSSTPTSWLSRPQGLHQRVVREHHVDRAGPRHAQAVPGAHRRAPTRRNSATRHATAHCSLWRHSPLQAILQRESLKDDLDSKFMVIFHNYGLDLETVQRLCETSTRRRTCATRRPSRGTSCGRAS